MPKYRNILNNTIHNTISRGFTLVEILVTMIVTSAIALGLNGVVKQANMVWKRKENRRIEYQEIRLFTEILRTELGNLYLPDNDPKTFCVEPGKIEYFTLATALEGSVSASRIAKVGFEYGVNDSTSQTYLNRNQQLYAGKVPVGSPSSFSLVTGRFQVKVFAYDNQEKNWTDTYNKSKLPPAIKANLSLVANSDAPEEMFQIIIPIICCQNAE